MEMENENKRKVWLRSRVAPMQVHDKRIAEIMYQTEKIARIFFYNYEQGKTKKRLLNSFITNLGSLARQVKPYLDNSKTNEMNNKLKKLREMHIKIKRGVKMSLDDVELIENTYDLILLRFQQSNLLYPVEAIRSKKGGLEGANF